MADFQLTNEYGFLGGVGGSCVFCNASKRTSDRPERIITTSMVTDAPEVPPGVWPEKYLEFCETCVLELGHLIGMIDENQAQELRDKIADLQHGLLEANDQNSKLQDELSDAVKALRFVPQPTTVAKK